jgi:hypothetical protein
MTKIYVASSLYNKTNAKALYKYLAYLQCTITYDWTTHGGVNDEASLKEIGLKEYQGVVDCDVLVMLMPARLGSHVELGIALALCKPVIIITNGEDFEKKSFYFLDHVNIIRDIDALKGALDKITEQEND